MTTDEDERESEQTLMYVAAPSCPRHPSARKSVVYDEMTKATSVVCAFHGCGIVLLRSTPLAALER